MINEPNLVQNKLDTLNLLKLCSSLKIEEDKDNRLKLVTYHELTNRDKSDVIKTIQESNKMEFFNEFFNIKDIAEYILAISAIVLISENKVIGFHKRVRSKDKTKNFYRPGYTFINEEYRGKGYYREVMTKYFENKKGCCWIDHRDTKKEFFFSSLGFKKTKEKGTSFDEIELGSLWVKI